MGFFSRAVKAVKKTVKVAKALAPVALTAASFVPLPAVAIPARLAKFGALAGKVSAAKKFLGPVLKARTAFRTIKKALPVAGFGKIATVAAVGAGATLFAPSTAAAAAGGAGVGVLSRLIGGRIGAAAAGATVVGAFAGGKPKRRRRRKRITDTEMQELMMLKTVLGPRSPALTIAAMKMLNRGG